MSTSRLSMHSVRLSSSCRNVSQTTLVVPRTATSSSSTFKRSAVQTSAMISTSRSQNSVRMTATSTQTSIQPRTFNLSSSFLSGAEACGSRLESISNGAVVFAIRHCKKVKKLGRPADQRKALLRGLTTELLRHGRIKTHENRAKAMRKYVDHIITLAKRGDDHARQQAKNYIYDHELVDSVFEEVGNRYGDRNGGYTRIFHTVPRRGDNTKMAIIELV